ncbi:MAG: Smr/MutS family protein [Ignavibacteria bacterium]|nr:Smr/MutS family protein [Ignavibacteria bacterium]
MPGDAVVLRENPSQAGTVIDVPREGHVTVAFGSMKMRVDLDALDRAETKPAKQSVSVHLQEERPKSEIDVRGMYGDDAIKTIDNYLYEAYTAGFERVDIIHGKGTGALRKRVHEYLRDVRIVASSRLGEWNEGTSGVTVVFFIED